MDSFLEACEAGDALRLEVEGPRPGRVRRRVLPQPFALVGRGPAADLRLGHAQVSLRHAYLQVVQGRLACFDLGGRGGVLWPDGRPARSGWVDPDRPVGIGPFTLRRGGGRETAKTDAPARGATRADAVGPMNLRWEGPGPDVVLEFPDQSGGLARWRMSRVVTLVGRAPGCRVRLPDKDVSWYHCALVRTQAGVWAVDLMSRVGLLVNDTALRYGRIDDGDELRVGPFRVLVRMIEGRRDPGGRSSRASPLRLEPFAPVATPAMAIAGLPGPPADDPVETELVEILSGRRGEPTTPAVVLLVEQFGRMQQQMLEQFNQSLLLVMQHLGEQYREHMRLVNDEIGELRRLTNELLGLKDDVRRGLPGTASPVTPAAETPALPGNGHTAAAAADTPARPAAQAGSPSQGDAAGVSRMPTPSGPAPAEDPLVMVSKRIAAIRGEQRSRWQRILDLVRTR